MLNFRVVAGIILFLISLPGVIINFYVFYKLLRKSGQFSGFQKLCVSKTIPNMIVCTVFLFWSTPLCILTPEYTKIPRDLNATLGQIAGWGAYIFGPILQVFLSINRFYVLYFPMKSMKMSTIPITNIAISFGIIIAIIYTVIGLPNECGFVFDTEILAWRPEAYECAEWLADFIFFSVLGLSITSNSFNFATFLKLVFNQVVTGVSSAEGKSRRRKRTLMYIQSVIQDSLHAFDIVNATFTYTLNDAVWFQFIFLSVSFLFIHAMDGFVMFFFHSEIHPTWLCKNQKKTSTIIIMSRSRVSTLPSG